VYLEDRRKILESREDQEDVIVPLLLLQGP